MLSDAPEVDNTLTAIEKRVFIAEAEISPRRWFRELENLLAFQARDEISSLAAVTQRRWPPMCKIAVLHCTTGRGENPSDASAKRAAGEKQGSGSGGWL